MAEASLLLKPDQCEVHGDVLKAIDGIYKVRLNASSRSLGRVAPKDALELIALIRTAVPHMEAFITGRHEADVLAAVICNGNGWQSFYLDALTPEVREACLALREEMRAMAVRILAARAAAKINDPTIVFYFRCGLISWTEPPFESPIAAVYFRDMMRPPRLESLDDAISGYDRMLLRKAWLAKHLPQICEQRLKLLRDFSWLTGMHTPENDATLSDWAPFVNICDPVLGDGRPMLSSDPVYVEFLRQAQALPVASLQAHVRALLEKIAKQPEQLRKYRERREEATRQMEERTKQGLLPPVPRDAEPPFIPVSNPEVVFHPIKLSVLLPDRSEEVFVSEEVGTLQPRRSRFPPVGIWIAGNANCDMVWIDELLRYRGATMNAAPAPSGVGLMKEKGRLRLLPLKLNRRGANAYRHTAACWDGSFFWIMGAGVSLPSAPNYGENGLLAAIDPQTEKIWEFSGPDGLPPSSSCAIAPLAPGKVCVAGDFGRSWIAVAAIDRTTGIKLSTIYEARNVSRSFDFSTDPKGNDPQVAHPVTYMMVLTGPAGAGRPAEQRVIVGRQPHMPWLVDLEKKEATCLEMGRQGP